jgi:long-chain fatty acid transport protein
VPYELQREWKIFRSFGLRIQDRLFRQEALGIDVSCQALLFESRTVTGNPNPTVNGIYQTSTHVGSMTMRVNF